MSVTHVTDAEFEEKVLNAEGPVLVDFWADWCGPCKAIAPALEEIAGEMSDSLSVAKLDVDSNPSTPAKYGIRGHSDANPLQGRRGGRHQGRRAAQGSSSRNGCAARFDAPSLRQPARRPSPTRHQRDRVSRISGCGQGCAAPDVRRAMASPTLVSVSESISEGPRDRVDFRRCPARGLIGNRDRHQPAREGRERPEIILGWPRVFSIPTTRSRGRSAQPSATRASAIAAASLWPPSTQSSQSSARPAQEMRWSRPGQRACRSP